MIQLARDIRTLELVSALPELEGFKALREEALRKVDRNESSVARLIFRSRADINPVEIEYSRGFRQGVMYVIDGLPNEIIKEFHRELHKLAEEADS